MDTQEIDFLIATKIMGYDRLNYSDFGGYSPSQNISAAWQIVEKLSGEGQFEMSNFPDGYYHVCFILSSGYGYISSKIAPLAICLAALSAVGVLEAKEEK